MHHACDIDGAWVRPIGFTLCIDYVRTSILKGIIYTVLQYCKVQETNFKRGVNQMDEASVSYLASA